MLHYRLLKQLKASLLEIAQLYDPFDEQLEKDLRKAMKLVYDKTCYRLDEYRETGIAIHAAKAQADRAR